MTPLIDPLLPIADRRTLWAKLSKKNKIIASCQDALYWLDKGSMVAETVYFDVKNDHLELCESIEQHCEVCALGSVFAGLIHASGSPGTPRYYGSSEVQISLNSHAMRSVLKDLGMSMKQVLLIEIVFEGSMEDVDLTKFDMVSINKYRDAFQRDGLHGCYDKQALLKAILKNIIENGARFVLPVTA